MPFLDQRTGALVVRVVYDGAAEAGKTTNLRRLEEGLRLTRRGARVEAPGSAGRRTQFFDWLDFQGGEVGGRPPSGKRCEPWCTTRSTLESKVSRRTLFGRLRRIRASCSRA